MRASQVDFFRCKPFVYWWHLALSATAAYAAAAVFLAAPLLSWLQLIAFPLAVFWLYRAGSMVHEVSHLPHNQMRFFKVAWNLIVGVPTLTPSTFFTSHHRDHHTRRMYGTPADPEYMVNDVRPGSVFSMMAYAAYVLAFPLLVFLRFLLAPLTFLHPRLRRFTLSRASSLTFNRRYKRNLSRFDGKTFIAIELLCWWRATLIPLAVLVGLHPWTRVPQIYLLAACILVLNQLRHFSDHHFQSAGSKLSLADHVLDSCNFGRRDPLIWLLFPFSVRFHALHHLFPSLPYHNLAAAHAHLLASLPADSPYRSLEQPGWWSVARGAFQSQNRRAALSR